MTENKQITKKYPGPEATGKFIKELRKAHNLTQDDLGSKVFVTRKAVSKWENGICYPSIDTIPFLADALDVTFDEILTAEFSDDNPLNDKNKYGYILRVLRSKQIKNLIKITIIFIMITLLIFYHENHNSTKIYKLFYEDGKVYLKNGLIITTRSKTYINIGTFTTDLGDIDFNKEISFIFYYKNKNNDDVQLLKYNGNTLIHNEKNYYKELNNIDIRNKLDSLYLKMIYKNHENKTKEYLMHLNIELYFQNDDILDYQKSEKENPFNVEKNLIYETEKDLNREEFPYAIDLNFLYNQSSNDIEKKLKNINNINMSIANNVIIITNNKTITKIHLDNRLIYLKLIKEEMDYKIAIEQNNIAYFNKSEKNIYNILEEIINKLKN